jgi:hypothetical protein
MTEQMDCQWIENNLEALFCDRLDQEQSRNARAHIENCAVCRSEVQALDAVDPLIKRHFQDELRRAQTQRPRAVRAGRVFGLSAATLALVAILLFVALRAPQATPVAPALPVSVQAPADAKVQAPEPVKNPDAAPAIERTKPAVEPAGAADRMPSAQPARSSNAPEFQLIDAAGYARKLEDFRGHIVVMGVWSGASSDAVANFERLYMAYGSNARFRFLGISNESLAKPANATFPVFYNQGSKLLGAQSGEFVMLDENGSVLLHGSLLKDIDELQRVLQK